MESPPSSSESLSHQLLGSRGILRRGGCVQRGETYAPRWCFDAPQLGVAMSVQGEYVGHVTCCACIIGAKGILLLSSECNFFMLLV